MYPMSIVPVRNLDLNKNDTHFLALLHLVERSTPYREFFQARAAEGAFILLDCSAVESPGLATAECMIETALTIQASEVMLPDVIQDMDATLESSANMLTVLDARFGSDKPFQIMVVPQGRNGDEWLECADTMLRWPGITTLGISYTTTNYYFGSRVIVLNKLYETSGAWLKDKIIHLLGCFAISEVQMVANRYPDVRSVDSAIAAIYAEQHVLIEHGLPRPRDLKARTINFETSVLPEYLLRKNLVFWRQQILNAGVRHETRQQFGVQGRLF